MIIDLKFVTAFLILVGLSPFWIPFFILKYSWVIAIDLQGQLDGWFKEDAA